MHQLVCQAIEDYHRRSELPTIDYNCLHTVGQLMRTVSRLETDKSLGDDMVSNIVYKTLPRHFAQILHPVLLHTTQYIRAPIQYKGSHLFALLKRAIDVSAIQKNSYRDIHLFDTLAKVHMGKLRNSNLHVLKSFTMLSQFLA